MANQLPADLKALFSLDELSFAMKGLTDAILEKVENPTEVLTTYGDRVNMLVQARASALQEKVEFPHL